MHCQLILYTGTLCHLCNQAKTLIYPLLPSGVALREINIDTDEALRQRYGFSIPVVAVVDETGAVVAEKNWPFTAGQIKKMLCHL